MRTRAGQQTSAEPCARARLRQLIDLGFPFSAYEQAPFVTRGIPAVTVTTGPDRPPGAPARFASGSTGPARPDRSCGAERRRRDGAGHRARRRVRRATSSSASGSSAAGRSRSCSSRHCCPSWPSPSTCSPAAGVAGSRVAPALRSYRSRLGFWLWVGPSSSPSGFSARGRRGAARPPALDNVRWPAAALLGWRPSPASAGSSPATGSCRAGPSSPRRSWPATRQRCSPFRSSGFSSSRRTRSPWSSSCPRSTSGSGCRTLAATAWSPARSSCWRASPGPRCCCGRSRPLRPRLRRRLVRRVALHARLRPAAATRRRPRVARRGGTARSARGRTLRPVPGRDERPPRGPIRETVRRIVLARRRRRRGLEPPRRAHG